MPAALIALPLVAGCGLGLLAGERVESTFALCSAASGVLALLSAAACACDDRPAEVAASVVASALVLGLSLGASASSRAYRPPLLAWFGSTGAPQQSAIVLYGRLRDDAAVMPAGVSLTLDVERITDASGRHRILTGGVRLSVAGELAPAAAGEWRSGRRIRATATLREPTVYLNPGVPDDRRALLRRGVALVGSVKSAALVEIVERGSIADEWASAARGWARRALTASVARWSDRSAGVASAIVLGDRTGLAQADERRLQEAGTYHVIAISGGNIAILTVLVLALLRQLRAPPRGAAAVAIVVLLIYGRITGASASVDRAIAAAVVVLAGRLLEHRGPPLNVLAAAAVLGVAASPLAVFDPGFVLSFGATLGILVGVPRLERRVIAARVPRWLRPPAALLSATIAAEVALAPISAALFARVTIAGLLLNFAAIPLMTIVQAGALVSLALLPVAPGLASSSGYVTHLAARSLVDSARLVEIAPWLARDVAPCAWSLIAAYYVALIVSLCAVRAARMAAVVAALLAIVIAIGPHKAARDALAPPPPETLRIVFIDVGQGDATAVILPGGHAFLVDAGGLPMAPLQDPQDTPAFDIGDRVVARALRAVGVRALDALVITHPDPDHLGGAAAILRSFAPRAVWEGVAVPPHAPRKLLRDLARDRGVEWRTVAAGDRLELGQIQLVVLHPPPPEWERQRVRNDDSIVLAVCYGDVTVILPGDIGREGESSTLGRLEPAPLTILKAPHHGSATSSTPEFLSALHPRGVIVSAGRNNRFGHPAPVVVGRYRAMGAAMFSTAEDGAVILDTDGRDVELRGWRGRRVHIGPVH